MLAAAGVVVLRGRGVWQNRPHAGGPTGDTGSSCRRDQMRQSFMQR